MSQRDGNYSEAKLITYFSFRNDAFNTGYSFDHKQDCEGIDKKISLPVFIMQSLQINQIVDET